MSVAKVVEEFIESKRATGKSAVYVGDLVYRCGQFSKAFNCELIQVNAGEIREWLASLNLSPRSQNNFRRAVSTLFEFAKKRGYLPNDHDEIEGVDIVEEPEGEFRYSRRKSCTRSLPGQTLDSSLISSLALLLGSGPRKSNASTGVKLSRIKGLSK